MPSMPLSPWKPTAYPPGNYNHVAQAVVVGIHLSPAIYAVFPGFFCVCNSDPAPGPFSPYDPGPTFRRYSLSVFGGLNCPYSPPIVAERDERCLLVLLMFLLQLAPG